MKSMTGLFHNNTFHRTWWIIEPTSDDIYHDGGLVMSEPPTKRDFNYWEEHNCKPVHVVEKEAYEKCLLDLNEMTAKYNFMVDSAQQSAKERDVAEAEANKYRNVYTAEAVTTKILGEQVEKLQNSACIELWGLNVTQILYLMNFYEAQTGNKAQDIK